MVVLGIDTCGPSGSVAIGRLADATIEIFSETPLEGRSYSATLVATIGDLLKAHRVDLPTVGSIIVVSGPGSFTGVRVGLSAAKGLAEGADLRIVAVSRLQVLANKAGLDAAALDAHRHEIFLRANGRELLAGPEELASVESPPARIAVCDASAAELLAKAWPAAHLAQVPAPTAADALRLAAPLIRAGQFADVLRLDGHYLRRSDAEIFGPAATPPSRK